MSFGQGTINFQSGANGAGGTVSNNIQTLDPVEPYWDATVYNWAKVTAIPEGTTVHLTSNPLTCGLLFFTQDETGGRTLLINGTDININPDSNSTTIVGFVNNGTVTVFDTNFGSSSGGTGVSTPIPAPFGYRTNVTQSGTDNNYLSATADNATALSGLSLPANKAGYIQAALNLNADVGGYLALDPENGETSVLSDLLYATGVWGGQYGTSVGGSQQGYEYGMINGNLIRIERYKNGAGVWTIGFKLSTDNGASWFERRTVADSTNGALLHLKAMFFHSGDKLDNVIGLNLV